MRPEDSSSGCSVLPIHSDDALLRRVRKGDVYGDGRIKKAAFMPRRNGEDRDGLSVSVEDTLYRDLHRAIFEQPGRLTATIQADAVHEIGLDVKPDPDPSDPRHALITGIPDRALGAEEELQAERFAQELAKRATQYTFPKRSGESTPPN
jgi:hypothetical protein